VSKNRAVRIPSVLAGVRVCSNAWDMAGFRGEGEPKSSTMYVKYVSGKPDISEKVKLYRDLELKGRIVVV